MVPANRALRQMLILVIAVYGPWFHIRFHITGCTWLQWLARTSQPRITSSSLVIGICGHGREEALPINDRPVDLARRDDMP